MAPSPPQKMTAVLQIEVYVRNNQQRKINPSLIILFLKDENSTQNFLHALSFFSIYFYFISNLFAYISEENSV